MHKLAWFLALLSFITAYSWGSESKQQPDSHGIYLIGDGVTPPRLTKATPAAYPADASNPHLKLSRTLSVVIGADGIPAKIRSSGSADSFNQAAVAAIEQSRFKAGTMNGKSVAVRALVWVPFVPGKKRYRPEILPALEVDRPPIVIHNLSLNSGDLPRKKLRGMVVISLVVREDGLPTDLRVVQSNNKGLEETVLEAAKHLRYRPAMKDGLPIPAEILVKVQHQ